MRAYRLGVNLKLGLIVAAVAIALGSLWYTSRLANTLQAGEQRNVELWISAINENFEASSINNPYRDEFQELERLVTQSRLADPEGSSLTPERRQALRTAIAWAERMPQTGTADLVSEIMQEGPAVPAIITDTAFQEIKAHNNVEIPLLATLADTNAFLLQRAAEMDRDTEPFRVEINIPGYRDVQVVHYGESATVWQLRRLPYLQFIFVGLFILVGYLGFSYVRRSEQNSLWVGMAKEAAHQLGTPISSMMGWVELLRADEEDEAANHIADELDKDVLRLQRVASRFSKIGSKPKLIPIALAPVVHNVADYMRRRMPRHGQQVLLNVVLPDDLRVLLNTELFEWVIENLIKNALDAMEGQEGTINITASTQGEEVRIDIHDTGKGIDKRQSKNIFRPGYSTKKRGWGLGLSLAKRIIEDYHGGSLSLAASRPGQGSTFRIVLNRAE